MNRNSAVRRISLYFRQLHFGDDAILEGKMTTTAYEDSLLQFYFDLAEDVFDSITLEFDLRKLEEVLARCCRQKTPRREAEFVFRITQQRSSEFDA